MGQALSRLIADRDDAVLVGAMVRSGSALDTMSSGLVPAISYTSVLPMATDFDVLIDVSGAAGFSAALQSAVERSVAFVSGSTGLDAAQVQALDLAAKYIPVLWTANFSVGVAVLAHLVREAARLLPTWDCEIFETHHRQKIDAPSGTAIMLGQRVCEGRGVDALEPAGDRSGKRVDGTIGYAISRGGDVVGEHEVRWIGLGERVELVHRASNRDIFAHGALRAACWLSLQAPGRYTMADMLGLGSR
jgi:4-hydroxy-tetrahydrodipicolinate reductase